MGSVALAALLGLSTSAANATGPSVAFVSSPGTSAPPSTLGNYSMTAFGSDPQPTGLVTGVLDPFLETVAFSPSLDHVKIGQGWATWSNGYEGDVYTTQPATSVTLTLPPSTHAFYFYAEPDPFSDFAITAVASDGTSSGPITVNGNAGARFFGFYTSSNGTSITGVRISSSVDFAVGEFGISNGGTGHAVQALTTQATSPSAPSPGPVCTLMGSGQLALQPQVSTVSSAAAPPPCPVVGPSFDLSFLSGLFGF